MCIAFVIWIYADGSIAHDGFGALCGNADVRFFLSI